MVIRMSYNFQTRLIRFLVAGGTAAVVAAVSGTTGQAQSGRPMTLNDLLTAIRVTEPALSPDGQLVAYVRTTTDLTTGKRNGDIYVVPADGSSPPKLVIGGTASESTPTFLHDSKQIAFISSRDGAPQVYVVSASGGEPRKITSLSAGVQPPLVVSPDGSSVAFVSDVFPSCRDEACNKSRAEDAEKDPVKVRRLTELMFRHWSEWREGRRHHIFVAELDGGAARDLTPGDFDAPPHNYEDGGLAFSPDSRQLAFVSKREGPDVEAWSTNMDVWITPVSGGELKKITSNPAADQTPVFSPDGRSLVVRSQRRAGFEADRTYLDVYDLHINSKRTVFTTPDLSVDEFSISPDGTTIWFTAPEQARGNLFTVPFAGGSPKRVVTGGAISAITAANGFAVFSKSALTAPADLFRSSADGSVKALTTENAAWLREVSIPQPESLTVPGAGGTPIQYWLLKPPNFNPSQKYKTVFIIHGGPQSPAADAWSSRWNPALWAAQGWVVVEPNPRGSPGFGQQFVDEISQDWGGKVMVDIDAVVNAVAKMPFVDADHLGIAGASYGGYAVNWIIGHTNRFKVAVSHDGVFNLESMGLATEELWFPEWEFGGPPWSAKARANYAKFSPHVFADKMRTPTLVITNELDFRVPVDQGLQLFTALRRQDVPAEALVFPDEGHWVLKALNSKRWHETVFEWIGKYL
jgi:dipeptidyl aminopeptidase/acylaminoacyl peptidase